MTQQPEALRLADKMSSYNLCSGYAWHCHKAAAELRRLHEVNQELLEALGTIRDLYEYDTSCGELASRLYDARSISILAIAKAEGGAA